MFKKRFFSKIVAIVMVLAMSTASTVYALDLDLKKDKELLIDDEICVSDFITYSQENNEYKSTISQQNLVRLKKCLDTDEISEEEMYTEIFRELGYSDEEIDEIGMDEINYIMESSIEITVNTQYVLIDEDGNREVVGKDDCLIFAEKVNAERELELQKMLSQMQDNQLLSENGGAVTMAAASNGSSNTETKGAMKITTVSSYINPSSVSNEKGWYNFSSTFKWLTFPSQSHNDAFSLYAAGCAWSQGTNDIYSTMSYYKTALSGGAYTEINKYYSTTKYTTDRKVQSDGVYYTYTLPADYFDAYLGIGAWHSDLTFYVRAKARVSSYNSSYAFNVFSQYEHLTKSFGINVAFAWKVGANLPGVTVSPTVGTNHTTYSSYNYTNYNPNVYK